MKLYNVQDYGIIADGKTLNTKKMQELIDLCASSGGGEIVFSKGEYVLTTVYLKSNISIKIEKDATIFGSKNFYDYDMDEKVNYPLYQDQSHSFFNCSMFVGKNLENVKIYGEGCVDMLSVWDEDNVRNIVHRGAKCIALKECVNVVITGLKIINVTDLAVYFAGCKNVYISKLKLRVHIDGISPDCCENVEICNCDVETGDDGIVFKSSYTLNRLAVNRNIRVHDCKVKSRCSAIKFGTETNGGFFDIVVENIDIYETRITGIALESVDGAIIEGITFRNITMKNIGAPIFVHLGKRLRGPQGSEIGSISNVLFENISVSGPYEPYHIISWNYKSFIAKDEYQKPWIFGGGDNTYIGEHDVWQMTSNVCGLKDHELSNITFRNIDMELDGGAMDFNSNVPEEAQDYPEVYVYGRILPAKGIYFRYINGLTIDNFKVKTIRNDIREDFVFEKVINLNIK